MKGGVKVHITIHYDKKPNPEKLKRIKDILIKGYIERVENKKP